MSSFTFNPKYITKTGAQIIDVIKTEISRNDKIESITGIKYEINSVNTDNIEYTGKNRNNGEPEKISFDNIKSILEILRDLKEFNTSNSILKKEIPNKIYKKRSPLFAILLATGIIIEV